MDDAWLCTMAAITNNFSGIWLDLFIVLILVLINGFFSASEMAIINLKDARVRREAEEGNKLAKKLVYFLDNQGDFLATIQVCITLAGFLSASFGADRFAGRLTALVDPGNNYPWLSVVSLIAITIIISYISLVLGELVPKRMAMSNPDKFSKSFVSLLRVVNSLLRPIAAFLNFSANVILKIFHISVESQKEVVTEEEIRMLLDISSSSGNIHEGESEMIENIFELNDTEVSEIMTHRTNIVALPVTTTLEELSNVLAEEKYSRVPIYEEDIDDIIGVISIKDIVQFVIAGDKENFDLKKLIRSPYLVPESKPVDVLFKDMQRDHVSMAIVIDEYGGTAGLVTLEDVLEEIVGNIEDEYDEESNEVSLKADGSYIISASLSLDEVEKAIDAINEQADGSWREGTAELQFSEEDKNDFDTLAGLVLQRLGRIPDSKEKPLVEDDSFIFRVLEMEDKRIAKIQMGVKWYNGQQRNEVLEAQAAEFLKKKDAKDADGGELDYVPNIEIGENKQNNLLVQAAVARTTSAFVREYANYSDRPDGVRVEK